MIDNERYAILGIDPGKKRIGVAIAHKGLSVASGLGVIEYKSQREFIKKLKELLEDESIGLVVMGLPKNMDGSEGESAKSARHLADLLIKELGFPVVFEDERLTTDQALKLLRETGKKVGKAKGTIDMMAAVNILQSYLDANP
ncbi:MAG: Holliday junction resolvase RuvX [candidate division Zixibacteria bacterium]